MEYRNSGNATHLGKGVAVGVDGANGTEIQGSTIGAISDSNNADLVLKGKGTGLVLVGSSNSIQMVYGESSYRPPALSSFAQDYSTFAMSGVSTGDVVVAVDFRGTLSTVYIVGTAFPSSAGECKVQLGNLHNSSVSGSSGRVRWAYLDRT